MKRMLLAVCALCTCCANMAEDGAYVTFKMNDAAQTQLNYVIGTDVDRIVFSGTQVRVQKGEKLVKAFDQASMDCFSFTDITDAIHLPGFNEENGTKIIYSIDGKLIGNAGQIKTLPKGVYVIRQGNVSHKIIIR